MTWQPPSRPSRRVSPRCPPSWRPAELEALVEQLVAGDELLHRVFLIEHPRPTARAVIAAAEAIQTAMFEVRGILYGRRSQDIPLALIPPQKESLPFP